MRKIKTQFGVVSASLAAALASSNASAFDWSATIGGIKFDGEIAAVAAIVGLLAGVYVVRKGARLVLGMLK
ncbi:hypothetical protein [Hahella sp. HN01]|uniref:hypothetical protein n=1 Tax=Hahella sp. HN01 TaxID=2847262 RepID=UPI001C1EC8D4|nr:hypothetical protein [Hahella sp. HN01]MBU6955542.1 hypothetical protein [Hahella sp. HN01]